MRRRSPNKYGFNSHKEPLAQLIGISESPEVCSDFKSSLKRLAIQYLDINETPKRQSKALSEIAVKILDNYPQWFKHHGKKEYERRIYFALRTISKIHHYRRKDLRHSVHGCCPPNLSRTCMHTNGKGRTPDVIEISDSESEAVASQQSIVDFRRPSQYSPNNSNSNETSRTLASYFKVTTKAPVVYSLSPSVSSCSSPGIDQELPEAPHPANRNAFTPATDKSFDPKFSTKDHAIRMSNLNTRQTQGISGFLGGCQPSMIQFLTNFVNYGCTTEVYLSSLAAFSQERRRFVLKKILTTCLDNDKGSNRLEGLGFSEMDLDILEDHIEKQYGPRT